MSISRHQAAGAYRRWEPRSLGDDAEADIRPQPAAGLSPAPAPQVPAAQAEFDPEPPVRLPTAADIEAMFEDARRDGHAAGYQEGAEQVRQDACRLAALAHDLDAALTRLDEEICGEVVALAIELARRMVRHTLAEQPSVVIETVRAALNELPQAQARIHLHPEDAALVSHYLAEQPGQVHHLVIEDASLSRGGCRILGAASAIDATVEMRWRRILEGLGRPENAWQESA
jgi:flagellar assembly protein FliH